MDFKKYLFAFYLGLLELGFVSLVTQFLGQILYFSKVGIWLFPGNSSQSFVENEFIWKYGSMIALVLSGIIISYIVREKGYIASIIFGVLVSLVMIIGSASIAIAGSNLLLITAGGFIGYRLSYFLNPKNTKDNISDKKYLTRAGMITSLLLNLALIGIIISYLFSSYFDWAILSRSIPRYCETLLSGRIEYNIPTESRQKLQSSFCQFPNLY